MNPLLNGNALTLTCIRLTSQIARGARNRVRRESNLKALIQPDRLRLR